jgi:hypothetical protein
LIYSPFEHTVFDSMLYIQHVIHTVCYTYSMLLLVGEFLMYLVRIIRVKVRHSKWLSLLCLPNVCVLLLYPVWILEHWPLIVLQYLISLTIYCSIYIQLTEKSWTCMNPSCISNVVEYFWVSLIVVVWLDMIWVNHWIYCKVKKIFFKL